METINIDQPNQPDEKVEAEAKSTDEQRYLVVVKVGGNELDDETFLFGLAKAVSHMKAEGHFPIIVHGGGKAIAEHQRQLGMIPSFVEGLRVTDDASLDIAEMVLSGLMNKRIVRALVNAQIRAAGISGVDDGTIYVEKMWHPLGDLGRVGEIQDVDPYLLNSLIQADIVPVVSPISFGALDAQSYNVNADHAATAIAAKLRAIKLIFISNVPGVFVAGRVARAIPASQAESWIEEGIITGGMIPKVRSAIKAVEGGVAQAVITNLAGAQESGGTGIIGTA